MFYGRIFYIAGFYGCPWTTEQRKSLFSRMQNFKMDTYLYAPKDDCKHRMYWRDLYSVEEAGMFETFPVLNQTAELCYLFC